MEKTNLISLETPIKSDGDREDSVIGDFIPSTDDDPEEIAYKMALEETIKEVLATLNPREQKVLELRFGLNDNRIFTLDEIGQMLGVTRERIRQIENKAISMIRKHLRRLFEWMLCFMHICLCSLESRCFTAEMRLDR